CQDLAVSQGSELNEQLVATVTDTDLAARCERHRHGATCVGSGPSGRSRLSARECARSVLRTSVRCPSSAARTAVAAAMDVLPTPPFPVYTMMRIPSDTRANVHWIEVHLPSGLLGMVYSATRCTPCLRSVDEPDLLWRSAGHWPGRSLRSTWCSPSTPRQRHSYCYWGSDPPSLSRPRQF